MADPLIQIRDQVHSYLWAAKVLGSTVPESHYFEEYPYDVPETSLPALNFFYTSDDLGHPGDDSDYRNLALGTQNRTAIFQLTLAAHFQGSPRGALNAFHSYRRAILKTLAVNRGLGGNVSDLIHVEHIGTDWSIDEERAKPLAIAEISFRAMYTDTPQNDS